MSGQIEMLSQQQHAMLARPAENGHKRTFPYTMQNSSSNSIPTPTQINHLDLAIEPITSSAFEVFFEYLNDHLADNGKPENVYFQPLPYAESVFSAERAKAFPDALDIPLGEPGWRRLWGAFTHGRKLLGHIDLRQIRTDSQLIVAYLEWELTAAFENSDWDSASLNMRKNGH